MSCNFSLRMLKYFLKNLKSIFCPQNLKKTPQKVAYLWQLGVFFLSAALPAQNSPELHFRFIISFIQSSLLRSLAQGTYNINFQTFNTTIQVTLH